MPAPEGTIGAHDRVIADIVTAYPEDSATRTAVVKGLVARREYGLAKYDTVLWPGHLRDALKDPLDEAEDLVAYLRNTMDARQRLVPYLWTHYQQALATLMKLRWLELQQPECPTPHDD